MKWRNGELHSLYYPPDITGFLKLMGINCSWHGADLGAGGRIILKWILKM
jgi:hypothetical protein